MRFGLNSNVLVLNRLWQAINVINARRALTLLYVGRGKIVSRELATYGWDGWASGPSSLSEDRVIRTVAVRVPVPRVIQLLEYDRVPRPRVRFTRANVYARDRHQCQYCGRRDAGSKLTLDHIHPRSRGGQTAWNNIVVSCIGCNARKRDRSPEEAGMHLLRPARQPRWDPTAALPPAEAPHPEWIPFLH